jgi:tRNA modification GTPase
VDTAGLREFDEPGDRVERIGIEKSRELLDRADLVLYVIDGGRGPDAAELAFFRTRGEKPPILLLWNKADKAPLPARWAGAEEGLPPPLPLSAKTGEGLAELCKAAAAALEKGAGGPERGAGEGDGGPALGSGRQKELVDRSCAALEEALDLADRGEAAELIAPSLREAVNALGEITGEVSTADILETIFSKFCVGK